MKTAYVIFRDDPNTKKEVYLYVDLVHAEIVLETETNVENATHFDSARAGYDFADQFPATLGNWRVGLR